MAVAAPVLAPAVTASVEVIDPDEAEEILGGNVNNRHVRHSKVTRYARAILSDQWTLNGETVKISDSGKLLDGQHRLLAVIEAQYPASFVVVRGLPESAQETIDIGDKRTLSDTLMLRGEPNANNLAAALMTAYRVSRGSMNHGVVSWPTNQDLLDYLANNPRIRESVPVNFRAHKNALRYPPSQAWALHFLMSEASSGEEADAFWNGVFDGVGLDDGSPVLTLRNFLIRDLSERRRAAVKFRLAVTIKAWNAVRSEKAMAIARWTSAGPGAEPFPNVL